LGGGAESLSVATLLLRMDPDTDLLSIAAEQLCATARWCYTQGWVPATSGNFSVRDRASGRIRVTASGLDKGVLTREGLLEIDGEGRVLSGAGRPSAETGLHLVLYKARPEAGAILHVHTVWNTLISGIHEGAGELTLTGYELLKGLSGVATHEHVEQVPILANSQDYAELTRRLGEALERFPRTHGVLLSRHGLYTWGDSVADARRHLEALEFLFEVEGRQALGGQGQ
jgi:methylthioribulose-1-phosphate dehydratase